MGQLLRYEIELPEPPPRDAVDLQKFLVRDFIGTVREGFRAGGFHRKREDGQDLGGLFVISVHGRIFEILKDFQVIEPGSTFTAIGWGAMAAMGALTALESFDNVDLRQRAEVALETSERLCWAVRRPFTFVDSAVPG